MAKRGPNTTLIFLFSTVFALSFLKICHATNNTNSGNSEAKSMEKGMSFLFQMTKGFLDVIQPNKIYEKYDIQKLQDTKYLEDILKNWQEITLYFIGYAVCIVIGIVFIVVMPIVGCCLCCCRTCCNKCGGKHHKHDPKNARYKRRCYVSFLVFFNTFILFAVVCTFVTNELYKKRFIDDPEIFNIAKEGTKDFILYIDTSFKDLKSVTQKQAAQLKVDLQTELKDAGNKSVTILSKNINFTAVMDKVEDLGNGVIELNVSVSQLSQSITKLSNLGTKLGNELETVKMDVLKKLKNCTDTECTSIADHINRTSVNAQFSQFDNQTNLLKELSTLLDIPDLAKEAKTKLDVVSENITDAVKKQNQSISESFDKITKEMDTSVNNVTKIKKELPFDKIDAELNKALDLYNSNETYTSIPWYIGLCVGTILLLIVICNYLGILFGLCGERAGDNTPCCNRGVAANFLLAGVGFYFLFCSILVLLVLIEFVVGGVLYTELCRYLNKNDPSKLKPILNNFNFSYQVFDQKVHLIIYDVVDKCYKNHSLLNSLNFPSSILKDQVPTNTLVDKINSIPKDDLFINVTLLDSKLKTMMEEFQKLDTKSITIDQYEVQLNKTVVTTDLNVIASNLTNLIANLSFKNDAAELRHIQNTTYIQMKNEMKKLATILVGVKKNLNLTIKVSTLLDSIKDVQNVVNINGTQLIRQVVTDQLKGLANIVVKNVDTLINNIINTVAPCRPVYNIMFSFTDIVCITFLNPLNGFWFSTGWAVFFFLPTIIFATKLAGLYRCWYKRDPTQENADSAVGDADNIPLARINQGKSSPQGMPNGAFDEISSNKYDSLPPHHPYNYGGPGPYAGYPVYPPPSYHDTRMNPGHY